MLFKVSNYNNFFFHNSNKYTFNCNKVLEGLFSPKEKCSTLKNTEKILFKDNSKICPQNNLNKSGKLKKNNNNNSITKSSSTYLGMTNSSTNNYWSNTKNKKYSSKTKCLTNYLNSNTGNEISKKIKDKINDNENKKQLNSHINKNINKNSFNSYNGNDKENQKLGLKTKQQNKKYKCCKTNRSNDKCKPLNNFFVGNLETENNSLNGNFNLYKNEKESANNESDKLMTQVISNNNSNSCLNINKEFFSENVNNENDNDGNNESNEPGNYNEDKIFALTTLNSMKVQEKNMEENSHYIKYSHTEGNQIINLNEIESIKDYDVFSKALNKINMIGDNGKDETNEDLHTSFSVNPIKVNMISQNRSLNSKDINSKSSTNCIASYKKQIAASSNRIDMDSIKKNIANNINYLYNNKKPFYEMCNYKNQNKHKSENNSVQNFDTGLNSKIFKKNSNYYNRNSNNFFNEIKKRNIGITTSLDSANKQMKNKTFYTYTNFNSCRFNLDSNSYSKKSNRLMYINQNKGINHTNRNFLNLKEGNNHMIHNNSNNNKYNSNSTNNNSTNNNSIYNSNNKSNIISNLKTKNIEKPEYQNKLEDIKFRVKNLLNIYYYLSQHSDGKNTNNDNK